MEIKFEYYMFNGKLVSVFSTNLSNEVPFCSIHIADPPRNLIYCVAWFLWRAKTKIRR